MTRTDRGELTQQAYWDQRWRRLDASGDHRADLGWVQRTYLYASLDRLLRSVLPVDPTKTFLELGSGPARWMIYFHRVFGYQVSGCDYSPASCVLARENLTRAGVPGTIHQADFFEFEGRYDVVYSAGVIEHFESPGEILKGFARLVNPGGYLVTSVPSLLGLNGLYRRVLHPETFQTHRTITLAELRDWHRRLGFDEAVATMYGSFCLNRLPADAFQSVPWLQRLWTPLYRAGWGGSNRACFLLDRLGVRIDGALISPHLLVVARRPEADRPEPVETHGAAKRHAPSGASQPR